MRLYSLVALVCVAPLAWADHGAMKSAGKAKIISGLGDVYHPTSTGSAEAQNYFDQGLALVYAFNHDEAALAFERAAELDPNFAMAYWGLALVKGPNYNLDADEEHRKSAYAALQKALKLAETAPEPERDYIRALAKRYSDDPKADKTALALAYKQAMGELAKKYPDDLDAATLYAESAMNLRPWKLWTPDGKPAEGTSEILSTLESVLRRNSNHTGANHYYIHAVEASPYPERGLACAGRIGKLAPAAGHLVHMAGHIYIRVGDYAAAARVNEDAIAADQNYFKGRNVQGPYSLMYYPHNIHFLVAAHCFQGRHSDAKKAAEMLAAQVEPHLDAMPMLEGFAVTPHIVRMRFGRWDEIAAAPKPPEKRMLSTAIWRLSRAFAALARKDGQSADQERQQFLAVKKMIRADMKLSDWNTAQSVLGIAEKMLDARLALAGGDRTKAIDLLRQAVQAEDALAYGEPPDWMIPVRETLGATLLLGGEPGEAEAVFRAALERHPCDGRCLFGLRESLMVQKKNHAAEMVDQQFQAAWRNADTKELRLEQF